MCFCRCHSRLGSREAGRQQAYKLEWKVDIECCVEINTGPRGDNESEVAKKVSQARYSTKSTKST